MKRNLSALMLCLLIALALAAPARADVMWEPIGDSFYDVHRDECSYVDRSYLANGQQGYVTLRKAPESAEEVSNVPNGGSVYVGYSWTASDGTRWYACEYALTQEEGWEWKNGWAPAAELSLIYDHICFEEDHKDEFKEYDGSGDALTKVCLYAYPGGPFQDTLEEHREYQPFSEAFQYLYTDEAGRRWSYVGYYMGRQNAWACLDDPMNEDLGPETTQAASAVRGEGDDGLVPAIEVVPEVRAVPTWLLPAGLVVAAAVVTAVIIRHKP